MTTTRCLLQVLFFIITICVCVCVCVFVLSLCCLLIVLADMLGRFPLLFPIGPNRCHVCVLLFHCCVPFAASCFVCSLVVLLCVACCLAGVFFGIIIVSGWSKCGTIIILNNLQQLDGSLCVAPLMHVRFLAFADASQPAQATHKRTTKEHTKSKSLLKRRARGSSCRRTPSPSFPLLFRKLYLVPHPGAAPAALGLSGRPLRTFFARPEDRAHGEERKRVYLN